MGKKKEPEFLSDLGADVIAVLADEETWTELPGCSLVIAPRGTFVREDGSLAGGRPAQIAKELGLKAPYGVVALDVLLKRLSLKKISEYLTILDSAPPPRSVAKKGK